MNTVKSLAVIFLITFVFVPVGGYGEEEIPVININIQEPFPEIRPSEECLVPCDEIVNGGPGKDGIPSIDTPQYEDADTSKVDDNELVAGILIDGQAYAFPYNIMNWHEIANLEIAGKATCLTYCPLTGSSIYYDRSTVDDAEFGVSGKLFENNLIMYDRKTDSYYSQMGKIGITGQNIGLPLNQLQVIETKWSTWKLMYPNTNVLTTDTGYTRDYNRYPYGTYETDNSIFFPTSYKASRSPDNLFAPKEKTLVAYLGNTTLLATFEALDKVGGVVNLELNGTKYFILSDSDLKYLRIFYAKLSSGEEIEIVSKTLTETLPLFNDNLGNAWNLRGENVAGPNSGTELEQVKESFLAFWFAAIVFNPDAIIYNPNEVSTLPNGTITSSDNFISQTNAPLIDTSMVYEGEIQSQSLPLAFIPTISVLIASTILIIRKRR